jgi:metallo-beta-lactamase class B
MKYLVLAAGLLLATAPAPEPFAASRAVWNKPQAPFRIAGNIYYAGTYDLGVYLIVTPKGDILIDGGLPESADQIEKHIAALGFKLRDIKILLNSHAHFDHAGGLARIKRDSGAVLYASAADTPILQSGHITFGPSAVAQFPPVHVDRIVADGETVSLGDATLTAHLTPGHTPGCTTWTMPVTDDGAAHNAVFDCSTTVAGNPLVGNKQEPNIVAEYRASFAKLKTLKADIFLGPHASFFHPREKLAARKPHAPNPFIDPNEFQAFNAASEKDFDEALKPAHTPTP